MAYAPPASSSSSASSAAYKSPAPSSNAPQGTFLPGTKVQVGSHRVIIEKYLSEGGFAYVYIVRIPRDNHKHELAVLKRVAVADRGQLSSMRIEVETMKKLQGHRHVVRYMDSHASQLKGGGYEVFLLMEYCSGGGLIDFMNTRLQHRLTEPEILKIFGDVAEGVAAMHYLKPPLLHRDLKVENVLISKSSTTGAPMYKICDFGSAASPRPAPKTTEEAHLIEEDVQKNTTMQYRSPEMIDVWRKQPIDEKADIWALGVLLYKLCYYTTPFENVGQMAILNASFKYPSYPAFSDRLKKLIGGMLKENPANRFNIYQVIKEVSSMRGTEVPIKDIYAQRTQSEARRNEALPSPDPPMAAGLQKQAPQAPTQNIPDITPMRRGRPGGSAVLPASISTKPAPSPARGDPFAALDSKSYEVRSGAVDELSKKYPSLDEFSITHDKGGTFNFPLQQSPPKPAEPAKQTELNERVTNALADQAFKQTKTAAGAMESVPTIKREQASPLPSRTAETKATAQPIPKQPSALASVIHPRSSVIYTSTGTGASPPPTTTALNFPDVSRRPIWKVPEHHRSSSQPRASDAQDQLSTPLQPPKQRPAAVNLHRSKTQTATLDHPDVLASTSSRPSLEGHRPAMADIVGGPIVRTKSAQARQRPSSAYVDSEMDFLRDQEHHHRMLFSTEKRRHSRDAGHEQAVVQDDGEIIDDMDYLRRNEEQEKKPGHRHSLHRKHSDRHSHSLSTGAKNILTGKFGDAFKRFEHQPNDDTLVNIASAEPILQYEDSGDDDDTMTSSLVPDGEATRGVRSDTEFAFEETEDLPPELKRELERQRLNQEERRVADATAEYRSHVTTQGTGGVATLPNKASTIQNRVKTLLDEAEQSLQPVKKTAEGYGRYTNPTEPDARVPQSANIPAAKPVFPPKTAKPIPMAADNSMNPYIKPRPHKPLEPSATAPSATAPASMTATGPARMPGRPNVPPKSPSLRPGGAAQSQWPPPSSTTIPPQSTTAAKPSGLAALLAKDLEGVPDYPPPGSSAATGAVVNGSRELLPARTAPAEDVETDFSRRYPSLSGIEMVETEIGGRRRELKARDV